MEMFSLAGKVALVTGGSRGIGADVALALAQAGADVALLFRSRREEADKTAAAIKELGRRPLLLQQDMAEADGMAECVQQTVAELGQLDVLVNNAGIADLIPFAEVDQALLERTLKVNVVGPFFLAQAAARHMVQRGVGGRIINLTSTNGIVAEGLLAPYNASKGAMEMLTKSWAIELGPHGITVNSVAPGLIATEIGMDFPLTPAFWDYAKEHIPLGKLGEAKDVAGAVVFLASAAGAYVNGTHIVVDGGLLADQFPRMQFYRGKK